MLALPRFHFSELSSGPSHSVTVDIKPALAEMNDREREKESAKASATPLNDASKTATNRSIAVTVHRRRYQVDDAGRRL